MTVRRRRPAVALGADQEFPMAEVIAAAAKRCAAAKPVSVLIVWETAAGRISHIAIPPSPALVRGLVDKLHKIAHPE